MFIFRLSFCQTAYFGLKRISSIRRFSLKTQPGLLLLPISSHGLTTATVSSWVHLILSSNLYRKFRTLLQDLFSWHPVTTVHGSSVLHVHRCTCSSVYLFSLLLFFRHNLHNDLSTHLLGYLHADPPENIFTGLPSSFSFV